MEEASEGQILSWALPLILLLPAWWERDNLVPLQCFGLPQSRNNGTSHTWTNNSEIVTLVTPNSIYPPFKWFPSDMCYRNEKVTDITSFATLLFPSLCEDSEIVLKIIVFVLARWLSE